MKGGCAGIFRGILMGWNGAGVSLPAGRRELGLKARRPARFSSRAHAFGFTKQG